MCEHREKERERTERVGEQTNQMSSGARYSGVPAKAIGECERSGKEDAGKRVRERRTVRPRPLFHVQLRQPKIAKDEMAGAVEEDILGLEISAGKRAEGKDEMRRRRRERGKKEKEELIFSATRKVSQARKNRKGNAPVDHIVRMQTIQRTQQFRRIEPASILTEPPLPLQVMEQLSPVHVAKDEVQLVSTLEAKLERNDER
jgi:hypothetical protein